MPCTAKKEEILRPESKTNGRQDIDYVLTTTELISMIKRAGIMFDQVEIESADVPFGIGSGAGVIFGVTGGVTEAVLRKITQGHKRADMEELKSSGVRGDDGIKVHIHDLKLQTQLVSDSLCNFRVDTNDLVAVVVLPRLKVSVGSHGQRALGCQLVVSGVGRAGAAVLCVTAGISGLGAAAAGQQHRTCQYHAQHSNGKLLHLC